MGRAPSCWTPPQHLPDLPPGEAVRRQALEVFGAPARFPPPAAPGYSRAARMGLLPRPAPEGPPPPVPGLSSWDRLLLGLACAFVAVPLVVVVSRALDPGGWAVLLAALPAAAAGWLLWSTRPRDRLEHEAGYTSGRTHVALWRLGRDGRVLREPDRSVCPPGWYPSPYYPGVLQRWDGPGWAPLGEDWWDHEEEYFRRPPTPFL